VVCVGGEEALTRALKNVYYTHMGNKHIYKKDNNMTKIIALNSAAAKKTGCTPRHLTGRNLKDQKKAVAKFLWEKEETARKEAARIRSLDWDNMYTKQAYIGGYRVNIGTW